MRLCEIYVNICPFLKFFHFILCLCFYWLHLRIVFCRLYGKLSLQIKASQIVFIYTPKCIVYSFFKVVPCLKFLLPTYFLESFLNIFTNILVRWTNYVTVIKFKHSKSILDDPFTYVIVALAGNKSSIIFFVLVLS